MVLIFHWNENHQHIFLYSKAALGYNKTDFIDYLCGGTLISEKHILTSGHCTNTKW